MVLVMAVGWRRRRWRRRGEARGDGEGGGRGGGGGGCRGCRGQACVSWESWVLHLNLHMLRPSGGCVNAHGDRWPRPITIESEHPGPPRERERGREGEGEGERERERERERGCRGRRGECSAQLIPSEREMRGGRAEEEEGGWCVFVVFMCICVCVCVCVCVL